MRKAKYAKKRADLGNAYSTYIINNNYWTLAVHVFCEHAIETKTDTSECTRLCVWVSSSENIGPVYKTYMFVLGEGGRGSKEMTRFRFFANIGNYGRPLTKYKKKTPGHHCVSNDDVLVKGNFSSAMSNRNTPLRLLWEMALASHLNLALISKNALIQK